MQKISDKIGALVTIVRSKDALWILSDKNLVANLLEELTPIFNLNVILLILIEILTIVNISISSY